LSLWTVVSAFWNQIKPIKILTNRIILGFETFRSWWNDLAHTVDLNVMVVEDIPCFDEALEQLKSLRQEQMPDAARIKEFNYHPEESSSSDDVEGSLTRLLSARVRLPLLSLLLLTPRGIIYR
jgi:wyosine [tRNA(Phe)-imidazoG37] synthetase (radical SAM superfamily)